MTKSVKIPATHLVESRGSFGHHKDAPRVLGESNGSIGHFKDTPETVTRQTVNGVTFVLPPDERKSR